MTHITTLASDFSCRNGSVITDFVVRTTQIIANELNAANLTLPEAMQSVAPVIGSVSAFYNSE